MKNNVENELLFEDISSSTRPKGGKSLKTVTENYGNGAFKHLDKIVKVIAFVVSLLIFLVFAAIATVLFMLDKIFAVVSVAVLIVGILLSLIVLFLIYAVGQILSQNNEILRRL